MGSESLVQGIASFLRNGVRLLIDDRYIDDFGVEQLRELGAVSRKAGNAAKLRGRDHKQRRMRSGRNIAGINQRRASQRNNGSDIPGFFEHFQKITGFEAERSGAHGVADIDSFDERDGKPALLERGSESFLCLRRRSPGRARSDESNLFIGASQGRGFLGQDTAESLVRLDEALDGRWFAREKGASKTD